MHENGARAKTPHAHKSPKAAPRTHLQPHHTRQNMFGLHQKRTNSQHKSKLDQERDQKHKRAQRSADGTANTHVTTPHPARATGC